MNNNFLVTNTLSYVFIFARMVGVVGFNPVFGRKGIPNAFKVGLVLMLTIALAPLLPMPGIAYGMPTFVVILELAKEMLIGVICGFVFQLFYYMLVFAGDLMDLQFGMSMAKVFDPGTNIQLSISSNILNIIFVLYLFATNSHHIIIRIFTTSYQIVPMLGANITASVSQNILALFCSAFALVLKLALPFVAAELVLEVCMGVLMKLIPQIHVFVINIQLKQLLGLTLLLLFASPISSFLDKYMLLMLENMQNILFTLV